MGFSHDGSKAAPKAQKRKKLIYNIDAYTNTHVVLTKGISKLFVRPYFLCPFSLNTVMC
jgi:hypothetical protein